LSNLMKTWIGAMNGLAHSWFQHTC
jgi:hypothetical protein